MTSSAGCGSTVIKIEDSPEPEMNDISMAVQLATDNPRATTEAVATDTSSTVVVNPKDPEGFLRRCSGYNKKTKARCNQTIGRTSHHAKQSHPTFLPTCKTHREQQTRAGWCQFKQKDGEQCARLFRWTPPYFELCGEHEGHSDTPCYLLRLPLELRQTIFDYLLPTQPIGSYTDIKHRVGRQGRDPFSFHSHRMYAKNNPMTLSTPNRGPLIDLLLVNHQLYEEFKDYLYTAVTFVIDIRKDGTFMCGRRLLEPRKADGSCHLVIDEGEKMKQRFTTNFDFISVKNYEVNILVENCLWGQTTLHHPVAAQNWDEEVEIYDIRDYVGVAVSGILGQSRNLCKLEVRLGFSEFTWSGKDLIRNTRCLMEPFERLRNVRKPNFCGVFDQPNATGAIFDFPLCSIPQLSTEKFMWGPSDADFQSYEKSWRACLSQRSSSSLSTRIPPIRAMFTEFKKFYTNLTMITHDVTNRPGKHAFLHRARVYRENEDVESFRYLRNELIGHWQAYLDKEEAFRNATNETLTRMLDLDSYPSHETEDVSRRGSSVFIPSSSRALNSEKMILEDGIPMQGNPSSERGRPGWSNYLHPYQRSTPQLYMRFQQARLRAASTQSNFLDHARHAQLHSQYHTQLHQDQVWLWNLQRQALARQVQAQQGQAQQAQTNADWNQSSQQVPQSRTTTNASTPPTIPTATGRQGVNGPATYFDNDNVLPVVDSYGTLQATPIQPSTFAPNPFLPRSNNNSLFGYVLSPLDDAESTWPEASSSSQLPHSSNSEDLPQPLSIPHSVIKHEEYSPTSSTTFEGFSPEQRGALGKRRSIDHYVSDQGHPEKKRRVDSAGKGLSEPQSNGHEEGDGASQWDMDKADTKGKGKGKQRVDFGPSSEVV